MYSKCIFCDIAFGKGELTRNDEQVCQSPSFDRIFLKYFGLKILTEWNLLSTFICVDNDNNISISEGGSEIGQVINTVPPLPLCSPCRDMMFDLVDLDTQLELIQSEISSLVSKATLSILDKFEGSTPTNFTLSATLEESKKVDDDATKQRVLPEESTSTGEAVEELTFRVIGDDIIEREYTVTIPGADTTIRTEQVINSTVHLTDIKFPSENFDKSSLNEVVVKDIVREKVHSLRKVVFEHYKPQVVLVNFQEDSSSVKTPLKRASRLRNSIRKRKRAGPRKKKSNLVQTKKKKKDDDPEWLVSNNDENGEKENGDNDEEAHQDDDPDYSDNIPSPHQDHPAKQGKRAFRSTKEIEDGIHLYRNWTFKQVETGFICLTCPLEKQKIRKNRTDCIKHINKRHNMDRARCDKCKRSYRNEKLLASHDCHPKVIIRKYRVKNLGDGRFLYDSTWPFEQIGDTIEYKCGTCGVIKRNHGYMTFHIKETHAEPTEYCCNDCGKKFVSSKLFRNHQMTHSDVLLYTCEECGRQCKSMSLLKTHSLVHQSHSFNCECGRSFKYKKSLARHRKDANHQIATTNVEPPRLHPLTCDFCQRKFLKEISLANHARDCTGIPRFPCPLCDKSFVKRSYIRKHLVLVHNKDQQEEEAEQQQILLQPPPQELDKVAEQPFLQESGAADQASI